MMSGSRVVDFAELGKTVVVIYYSDWLPCEWKTKARLHYMLLGDLNNYQYDVSWPAGT